MAQKACVSLNLSVAVYLGNPTVTELRWRNDDGTQEYRAWSNADFRYLVQVPFIETETTVYQLQPLMFLEAYAAADFSAGQKPPIPDGLNLSTTEAEYVVDSSGKDWPGQETPLTGLDYLLAYYQLHYADLKAAYEKGQADSDAEEKALREHPPVKPDTDGDGMSDGYEIANGLNPLVADGTGDLDGDGVPNQEDARPNDPTIGRLTVTIAAPLDGAVFL